MRVTDPRAIRALAHPLRLDLLELLGGISPATAARCAEVLGVSQALASYHLRQLAKYGFVELDVPTGDQRERPWRVVTRTHDIDAGHHPAADELSRVSVEREVSKILGYLERRPAESDQWREAATLSGATLPMTADELAEVREQIETLLRPYRQRVERLTTHQRPTLPAAGRWVRVFLSAVPYPELDLAELRPADGAANHD